MSKTEHNYLLIIILLFVLLIAITIGDIYGSQFYLSLSGTDLFSSAEASYWSVFWTFSYGIGILLAVLYFIFRRDISETVAITLGYFLIVFSGIEDILYFMFQGLPIPETLPWLWETPVSLGSRLLGETTVTSFGLHLNAALFLSLAVIILYSFREYF